MAFTESYCDFTNGSNLNAGSTNAAPALTYASGNWVQSTRVFTVASGNPVTDGVAVDDAVSVYPDGSSVAVYVGRVSARDATTITVHATRSFGTTPTDGTGNRTLVVGGYWKGPNAGVNFPFNLISSAYTNASSDPPRVNLKNNATYAISTGITHSLAGVRFEGFSATPGDGGRATIDGSTNAIVLLTLSGNRNGLVNLIFSNNGSSGTNNGVTVSGDMNRIRGCVFHTLRASGLQFANGDSNRALESEAYACNASNSSSNHAGFSAAGTGVENTFERCISHDHTAGVNADGFSVQTRSKALFLNCIADTCSGSGFRLVLRDEASSLIHCDAYNNSGDGITLSDTVAAGACFIENCNLIKNGGYGIAGSFSFGTVVTVLNCGFGAGTQANTSGQTNGINASFIEGSVTYASDVTPWADPANGDFRTNLAEAINAGRGTFTQTAGGYAGAVSYPDLGSNQHLESSSSDVSVSGCVSAIIYETGNIPY